GLEGQDAFFRGILAPAFRASLSAIATACLRLLTLPPLPDLRSPSLYSFMTLWTFRLPAELDDDLAMPNLLVGSKQFKHHFVESPQHDGFCSGGHRPPIADR